MNDAKRPILPHSRSLIDRLLPHRWAAATLGGVSLLSMVAAYAIAPAAQNDRTDLQTVLERLPTPTPSLLETGQATFVREEAVQRSDTVASLLNRLGVTDREALHYLRSGRLAQRLAHQLQPGATVTAKSGQTGELHSLHFPIAGKDATLLIERRGKSFVIREQAVELDLQTTVKSGAIVDSWLAAVDAAGVPDSIASQLIAILGSEIDFHRDLRKGDRFSLVYETYRHRGQTVRNGRILAAEVCSGQKVLQAYWFQPERGAGAYYAADGRSLSMTFLRSPIDYSPLESSQISAFAGFRLHPILQTWRAHKGVDYPAPTGTPVLAAADAIVDTAEYQNNGYGKLIVLKHHGAYSSAYGHLKDFAEGLRQGMRVRQGDTIGYVGQTGLASGPHLHYELRVNDEQVDPAAIALPAPVPLERSQRARQQAISTAMRAQIELAREITLAAIE